MEFIYFGIYLFYNKNRKKKLIYHNSNNNNNNIRVDLFTIISIKQVNNNFTFIKRYDLSQ